VHGIKRPEEGLQFPMSTNRFFIWLALWLLSPCMAAERGEPPALTMSVEPSISQDGAISVQFRLRYSGIENFEAEASSLPGVQRRNTIAIDVSRYPDYDNSENKPCGTLNDIIVVDDPGTGWRRVQPGEEWVENVKLSDLVSGVKDVVGHCDIVINWSYKMYTRDKVRFPRMAGSIVVPSNRRAIVPPDVRVTGDVWKYERTAEKKP
jgi:hypothetical protein